MSFIKRRRFLQIAGSTLATIGWSQIDIQRQGFRYAKVLAQNTPRKLALLVGVNGYPQSPLKGCVNDALLQKELLIHRFGFNAKDVVVVADDSDITPTRQNILDTFEGHLIGQAKPGDVVVFHFSGHGSQVYDPDSGFEDQLNSTFIPIDKLSSDRTSVSDIMGATLFLLMSAIDTENFTAVLDSCHSGGGKRGNLLIRAISGGRDRVASQIERQYQQKWRSKLGLSLQDFIQQRQKGVAKGVVIASAMRDQLAADKPFEDFYAGAFTHTLTQYLWQETGNQSTSSVVANVSRSTTKISSLAQVPEYEAKSGRENEPIYFIPKQTIPAEAVVTNVRGKQIEFWLGGIDADSLAAFDRDAVFTLLDAEGKKQGLVKLAARQQLLGRGNLVEGSQPTPGLLLQERSRSIPDNLTLRIGLDDSLGNDASAAQQALAQIKRVEAVSVDRGEVHYIFGRMTEAQRKEVEIADSPAVGSLGLYAPGLDLIPSSFGASGESIGDAITRLTPKLRSLLAARSIKMTLNADTSRLNISASMKLSQGQQVVASTFTVRGAIEKTETAATQPVSTPIKVEGGIAQIPVGSQVQFQIDNQENRNLYVTVLVLDPQGEIAVVFPNTWTADAEATLVRAGETRRIPEPGSDNFQLTISPPAGTVEVLIVASVAPLQDALKALQSIAANRGQTRGPVALNDDPVGVVDSLLGDIDRGTRSAGQARSTSTARTIDTTQLGAMSITFRAV